MNDSIEIHGQQWKVDDIRENVEWSRQQVWQFKKYEKKNEHDHCLICYWTIFATDDPNSGEAYFYGGSTWLCKECHEKFVEKA